MNREYIINPTQVDAIFISVSLTSDSVKQDCLQILMTTLKYSVLLIEIKSSFLEKML